MAVPGFLALGLVLVLLVLIPARRLQLPGFGARIGAYASSCGSSAWWWPSAPASRFLSRSSWSPTCCRSSPRPMR